MSISKRQAEELVKGFYYLSGDLREWALQCPKCGNENIEHIPSNDSYYCDACSTVSSGGVVADERDRRAREEVRQGVMSAIIKAQDEMRAKKKTS